MSENSERTSVPDWARPGARCTMSIEPAIALRTAAFDWDYEVQVALPASYGVMPDKRYPVLWLTDGPLLLPLAVGLMNTLVVGGLAPEMIVVGVGCPSEAGVTEFGRRRAIDFAPPGKSMYFDGPGADYFRKLGMPEGGAQQADDLLAFLVDEVRPSLSRTYRLEDDHTLVGHSGGGMFASYALFARPGAFRGYIIGSPSSNAADRAAFRLEADYAAANTDLEADVLFRRGRTGDRQAWPGCLGNRQRSSLDGRDAAAAPIPVAQAHDADFSRQGSHDGSGRCHRRGHPRDLGRLACSHEGDGRTMSSSAKLAYPPVEARPEIVEFGGALCYADPYRWLEEEANGDVLDWQDAQDKLARDHLAGLPRYNEFLSKLQSMSASDDVLLPAFTGGRYIRRFVPAGQDLEVVELSDSPTGPGRRVVDLNAMRTDEPLQMAGYALSHNGKLAVFAHTAGGREKPIVQLVEVQTGKILSQRLPSERLGNFTWLPDDSGYFYMSMDAADIGAGKTLFRVRVECPQVAQVEQVEPSHFYVRPVVAADRRHVLLFVNHLAPKPEFILDTQGAGTWQPFLKDVQGIFRGDIVGDYFFAITDDGAPRGRMVAIPLATPARRETWKEVVPPSDDVLANVIAVGERAVVLDYVDTYSRLRVFDRQGELEGEIDLPGRGLVNRTGSFFSFFNVTNTLLRGQGDHVDFLFATPTDSPAHYTANVGTRDLVQLSPPERTLDARVLDCKAVSKDGAEVVYHVIARSDLDLSKPHPTVITGYGGFNVAVLPGWFGNRWAAWIEAGGIFVLSHLRGGGEFGSNWWQQGRLKNKQNTFNNVYATAEDLIARGITTPRQLGITGGSNGGVMAAVAAIQRPDLFRASSPEAPIADVLGRRRDPFTMAATLDYGDPSDAAMAQLLYGWSPYQNVKTGVDYPAMLIDCGVNDPRCPPWHGRKLAARMQAASSGALPILLRVRAGAGHGAVGHEEQTRQAAEVLAFFAEYLGLV